jgi:hypothetical protein
MNSSIRVKPGDGREHSASGVSKLADLAIGGCARVDRLFQLEFQSVILGQVSDAIISIDNGGRVTYLNASAAREAYRDRRRAVNVN